jgi:hypothetical protein
VLLAVGACFDPPTANISFRCGPDGACPDRYECRDDGCCHLIGSSAAEVCTLTDASTSDTPEAPDAPPPVDAPPPDAEPPVDAPPPDAPPPDAPPPDAPPPDAPPPDAPPPDAA